MIKVQKRKYKASIYWVLTFMFGMVVALSPLLNSDCLAKREDKGYAFIEIDLNNYNSMADADTISILWLNKDRSIQQRAGIFLDHATKASLQKNYPNDNQNIILTIKEQNWDKAHCDITFSYYDAQKKQYYKDLVKNMEFRGRFDNYIHYDLKTRKVVEVKNE